MNKLKIKTVIFDMNGVIVDDEPFHEAAFKKIASQYGINLKHKDYLHCCTGRSDLVGFECISKTYSTPFDAKKAATLKEEEYQKISKNKKPVEGVVDAIKELSTKYPLGVCSGAIRKELNEILEEFGIKDYFKATLSADETDIPKPDPDPYLKIAKLINFDPRNCLVIEDAINGIESAKAAGMQVVGFVGTHTKEELEAANADLVIEKFKDFTSLLA